MVKSSILRMDHGILYRDYVMAPAKVLMQDPCPFGFAAGLDTCNRHSTKVQILAMVGLDAKRGKLT